MNVWTKNYPKEPGYYWVKRVVNGSKEIVYLSKHDIVLQFGTREGLSSHYDIREWGPKVEAPAD